VVWCGVVWCGVVWYIWCGVVCLLFPVSPHHTTPHHTAPVNNPLHTTPHAPAHQAPWGAGYFFFQYALAGATNIFTKKLKARRGYRITISDRRAQIRINPMTCISTWTVVVSRADSGERRWCRAKTTVEKMEREHTKNTLLPPWITTVTGAVSP
jgi:hypothetical protein